MRKDYLHRTYQGVFRLALRHMNLGHPDKVSGIGSIKKVSAICREHGVTCPLLVIGPRLVKSELFKELYDSLPFCSVYSRVPADPTTQVVEELVQQYRDSHCDGFIALGGGSNMDAAKACAARIARPHKTVKELGGTLHVHKKTPYFIAIPTTAGTGSECTVAAVITDEENHRKYAINDPVLCPDTAVLDPAATVTMPPHLTATTGMDALTHAIEAFLNKPYHNEETVQLCEDAVKLIFDNLKTAYMEPDNLAARTNMLEASYTAGRAFTVACVGNVHAIAHTIGGLYHVSHGLANAVTLPYVLEEYGRAVEAPLAHLALITGLVERGKVTRETAARTFIEHIRRMNEEMGIPEHIPEIQENDVLKMATWADQEANPLYPVPVIFNKDDFAEVLMQVAGK